MNIMYIIDETIKTFSPHKAFVLVTARTHTLSLSLHCRVCGIKLLLQNVTAAAGSKTESVSVMAL